MGLISEGLIRSGHRTPSPSPGKSVSCTGLAWRKKSWGAAPPREAPGCVSVSGRPGDQVRSSAQSDRAAESRPAWTSHPPLPKPEGRGPGRLQRRHSRSWSQQPQPHRAEKSPLGPSGRICPGPLAPERAVLRTRTEAAEPGRASGEVMQSALKAATLHPRTPRTQRIQWSRPRGNQGVAARHSSARKLGFGPWPASNTGPSGLQALNSVGRPRLRLEGGAWSGRGSTRRRG